jgi:hypothetical protein
VIAVAWLRREPEPIPADPAPEQTPDELRAELAALIRYINVHSGSMPAVAVVTAREITDALGKLIGTADRRPDIYTSITIAGILTDHLPTTVKTFLTVSNPGPDAVGALREQLESLLDMTISLQEAEHAQATNALTSQGNFLRTKFSNSDLDL